MDNVPGEIEGLVSKIQEGHSDFLPALWDTIREFVAWAAKRHWSACRLHELNSGCEIEDYIQEGYLALLEAVESYDPARGASFPTFLLYHLRRAFSRADGIRTSKRDGLLHADSLDRPIDESDMDSGTLLDKIAASADPLEEAENRIYTEELHKALLKALGTLTQEQREIIQRRYFEGATLKTIASERGETFERVQRKAKEGIRKLQQDRKRNGLEQFVEEQTPYYRKVSVTRFNATGTSSVEEIFLYREQLRSRYKIVK